jgi:ATP-dependent DNA helicase RecG
MTHEALSNLLAELRALPEETEWVEFKSNWDRPEDIGEYISALANAAAFLGKEYGYIVWGIRNGSHEIIGTQFQPRQTKGKGNEDLEPWLLRLLNPRIDFRIYEFEAEGKKIVLFETPAARETPVAFSGQRYIRVGSHRKLLHAYPEKEAALWKSLRSRNVDWSSVIIEEARLDDLDPAALAFARKQYQEKHPQQGADLEQWDNVELSRSAAS